MECEILHLGEKELNLSFLNKDTKPNMLNLTSFEDLSRFYEYEVKRVLFDLIEHLSLDFLMFGMLGWRNIKITSLNIIRIKEKKKWVLEICSNLFEFYPKEILRGVKKINPEIQCLKKVKESFFGKNIYG